MDMTFLNSINLTDMATLMAALGIIHKANESYIVICY